MPLSVLLYIVSICMDEIKYAEIKIDGTFFGTKRSTRGVEGRRPDQYGLETFMKVT